jgi:S-disulfanyl-L-cysteine oxidoreductase SoxD
MTKRVEWLPLALTAAGILVLLAAGYVSLNSGGSAPHAAVADDAGTALPPLPALDADAIALGASLYATHCAACHGAKLEGQPNWKKQNADGTFPAPPHDDSGHTWHHPDALLSQIIRAGGNGNPAAKTNMPAYGDKLTDAEIAALLDFFKSRWSPDKRLYQWQMTVSSP